jgi:hypothetical protein
MKKEPTFHMQLKVAFFHSCASYVYEPFPSTTPKLQNPASKMLFLWGGKKFFLTSQNKWLEFKAVFLSHQSSTVTLSMQNKRKNANQCYKVENETWVCICKGVRSITLEFLQAIETKKIQISLGM